MEDKIKNIIFYLGLATHAIGLVSLYRSIIGNPLYSLIIMGIGFVLIAWYCQLKVFKKEKKESIIMDIHGRTREYSKWAYPPKYRMKYGLIFAAPLILIVIVSFNLITRPAVVAGSPMDGFRAFKEQNIQFSLVDIHRVAWYGGGAYAVVEQGSEEKSYPYATIISRKDINKTAWAFKGHACALNFEIEARKDLAWVSIDEVRVKVIAYSPLPAYHLILPAPVSKEKVCFVELDDPKVAKTNIFMSEFLIEQGERTDWSSIMLKQGNPEKLFVRINAKTPGIYTLQCELLVRNEKDTETVKLTRVTDWLFNGKYIE